MTPTPEQLAIIEHIRDNPTRSLMADARAGAAKTSTIVMASEHITQPAIMLAFNKRNQLDLEERIPNKSIVCKTLNAVGHAAWANRMNTRLKLDADKMYAIATKIVPKSENDTLIESLTLARKAKSRGLIPFGAPLAAPSLVPDHPQSWEDIAFESGFTLSDTTETYARKILLESITQAFQGTIDFDDQIYMSVLFGGVYPKYHTVVVDEAQDLSPLNHRQLQKLTGTRLIAIGDPYQAIYAFRGADSNSMTNLAETVGKSFDRLGLTYSFRAPHSVAARQLHHVPDFKSWSGCKPGKIETWKEWSIDSIPREGFVLCRNNAPLMRVAFALIKARRPVTILGRDIGASLASLLMKIAGKGKSAKDTPVEAMIPHVESWAEKERAKVGKSESKLATIRDREESLIVLLEASGCKTVGDAAQFIRDLFADRQEKLVLSSGHRAKGLEADWVLHLDPWRCPSKMAIKAAEHGDPSQLIQEYNLKYVIETRTKDVLIEANLDQCEELL